jgi:hypothetical protein
MRNVSFKGAERTEIGAVFSQGWLELRPPLSLRLQEGKLKRSRGLP